MAIIKAQKIPKEKQSVEDILAVFCYYYQQYTFAQARKLPFKRISQMLRVARKEHARFMIDLAQVAAAPHGKKGSVKNLIAKFNDIINQ